MTMIDKNVPDNAADEFASKGYILLKQFYDPATLIAPIHEGIRKIVEFVCKKYNIDAPTDTAFDAMTIAYPQVITQNRAWGGEIYDAIKHIPAFLRLVSDASNEDIFQRLRPGSVPGITTTGYGMRIDNPGEEKFRAQWHQEFPSQLRSVDGIVFWTPLLPMSEDMGPVQIAEGSHAEGLVPVYSDDAGASKTGAYALHLDRAEERLARYKHIAPLTNPGDLVLMDFLTLHQSGHNVSKMPRWSIQFRFFNYADPLGIRIGWQGSFMAGVDFKVVLPELVATREEAA
ncbi:phytanoyl-CoA dioxygenase family protein [Rhizobium laguerreae]|uniref:phytanoyl-CoA dioxygenase family protein n=1 Tax=Rhizobium laguerreae TaxID=1076926 RepID=UPI001040857E|nr:phytanoyl-CoA dioxygenase family protein [Rhizobium laguerreae]MBY3185263.1 phytanoyl-CoA dioxygenase [Rhizobium laguerreae]MBY3225561.1 phytanoyl-CoA dioxygenase [Rhizobium laguerreae]MBY3234858.1 phytanoyl-CoA dioxygenase [Rhizobium laguerreae]MBY3381648.1 phytanoyl-CoA dioxygenase [Rhizobium laguerreae]NKM25571.1 phytanoyl-CoA dioxygenase [Rhizobium laguerreae]